MDATSRRICLGGVLKTNSCPTTSFFLFFLFDPPSSPLHFLLFEPYLFGHSCRRVSSPVYGACKRYRSTLPNPISSPYRNERRFFSTSNAPSPPLHTFVSVSRFSTSFPSLEQRNVWSGSWNGCAEKWRLPRRKLLLAPFNFKQIGSGDCHKGPIASNRE